MDEQTSISVETRLEHDGVLTLTGLPFRAGHHLHVQIEAAAPNSVRRFPMRGRPYQYADPFESASSQDDWEATR